MNLNEYCNNIVNSVQNAMTKEQICSSFIAELTEEDFEKWFGNVLYGVVEVYGVRFLNTPFTGPFTYPLTRPCPTRVKNIQSIAYAEADGVKLENTEITI